MEEKEIIEKLENLENQLRFYQQLGAGFMVGEKKKPADEEKPAGELIGLKKETESPSPCLLMDQFMKLKRSHL